MKVAELKEVVPDVLIAARFEGEELDEFDRLLSEWTDFTFLRDYFRRNEEKLTSGFYEDVGSVDTAIEITMDEAERFEELLLGKDDEIPDLSEVFKPFHPGSITVVREHSKAYGPRRRSWLRIFAIRITDNYYAISGGGIKLTRTVQEADGMENEIPKLECLAQFLKEIPINDPDDYYYTYFDL